MSCPTFANLSSFCLILPLYGLLCSFVLSNSFCSEFLFTFSKSTVYRLQYIQYTHFICRLYQLSPFTDFLLLCVIITGISSDSREDVTQMLLNVAAVSYSETACLYDNPQLPGVSDCSVCTQHCSVCTVTLNISALLFFFFIFRQLQVMREVMSEQVSLVILNCLIQLHQTEIIYFLPLAHKRLNPPC